MYSTHCMELCSIPSLSEGVFNFDKTGNDDTLKLIFHDKEKHIDFKKDLEICRRLKKLKIEK